jgi:hypothetical protein
VLALAIGAGLSADLLARLATHSFDSLQATYNMWVVPAIVLTGASAVVAEGRLRVAGRVGAALLLGANLMATLVLIQHGESFAHSAGDRINAEVARLGGPDGIVIVHENPGPEWQFAFCPLRYAYGGSLRQYLAKWGADGTLQLRLLPEETVVDAASEIRGKHLAIIHVEDIGAEGVVRYMHTHQTPVLSDDHLRDAFVAQGWQAERRETLMALGAEQVDWMSPPAP